MVIPVLPESQPISKPQAYSGFGLLCPWEMGLFSDGAHKPYWHFGLSLSLLSGPEAVELAWSLGVQLLLILSVNAKRYVSKGM